jgi:putative tricarboxylic transport membrane protein
LFEVGEVGVFGVIGAVLLALDFPIAPIMLGYVLGPLVEENFRRTLLMSHGDLLILLQRPVCAAFLAVAALVLFAQLAFWMIGVSSRRSLVKA